MPKKLARLGEVYSGHYSMFGNLREGTILEILNGSGYRLGEQKVIMYGDDIPCTRSVGSSLYNGAAATWRVIRFGPPKKGFAKFVSERDGTYSL